MALKDFFTQPQSTVASLDYSTLQATINGLEVALLLVKDNGDVILSNRSVERLFGLPQSPQKIADVQNVLGQDYNLQSKFFSSIYQKQPLGETNIVWNQKYLKIDISPVESVGNLIVITDQTEEHVLDRSRDEFFSIASHELRTPLTIIKGNSSMLIDLLKAASGDENQIKIAQDILSSSDRLITIINNLLEISELEHKKIQLKIENFVIRDVAAEVLTELNSQIVEKNIQTPIIASIPELKVSADRERVKEILRQLLKNSFHYVDSGKVSVSISKVLDFAEISVTDTGSGIPAELQSLLFRKFQQAGESLYARKTEGVGLGLYICKLLVEQMGGKIKLLTSTPGIGTTFSFTLPLAR